MDKKKNAPSTVGNARMTNKTPNQYHHLGTSPRADGGVCDVVPFFNRLDELHAQFSQSPCPCRCGGRSMTHGPTLPSQPRGGVAPLCP